MREALYTLNRGRVSPLALARVDQKRIAVSAEVMTNWIPRVLGPMSIRPGLGYILATRGNNLARYIEFVFSLTDTALLEITDSYMRVIIDDELMTRPAITTTMTDVSATATDWTDNDEVGAASGGTTYFGSGVIQFLGNGSAFAIRDQQVTVPVASQNIEHALRIEVRRGPIILRVGSTSGGDEYITETSLGNGTHSLAFTPTGDFHVRLMSNLNRIVFVLKCDIESAGVATIPTSSAFNGASGINPWLEADLPYLRYEQSANVVFVAAKGKKQKRIERRGAHSWSIVDYDTEDGPFNVENVTTTTITPSAITGGPITLTASRSLFKSTDAGRLYRLTSTGQVVSKSISAENTFSDPIYVTGVGASFRTFTITISGTWAGTVTLQRSLDSDVGPWSDVATKTWTANTTETFNDALDNLQVWYRIGIKTGGYTSGTAVAGLFISTGSITGVVRIVFVSSETVASADVLKDLGGTAATEVWASGLWSDRSGWPSAVKLHDGRLWWAGKDKLLGSVSDGYHSFDPDYEGDAGPISRTVGSGPIDNFNWIMSLQRLIIGAESQEITVKASSLDDPLTPTAATLKGTSSQGSAPVDARKIDQSGIFVHRNGISVYELGYDNVSYEYSSNDLMELVPEMGEPGIIRLGVQRKPDTRIHAVRSDGTVALGIFNKAENVLAWIDVETDGFVEDVVVTPGANGQLEDNVYYVIKRTVNSSTVRYLEKWALESECRGAALNKMADSFIIYSGVSTNVLSVAHLEGKQVVVWGNGKDLGTYTVSSGAITISEYVTQAVVGLLYTATFKSSRLGINDKEVITALVRDKRVMKINLLLAWVHAQGLEFGPDFTTMDNLPKIEGGTAVSADAIRDTYNEHAIVFPGGYSIDTRICLRGTAPRPCTVLAIVPDVSASK